MEYPIKTFTEAVNFIVETLFRRSSIQVILISDIERLRSKLLEEEYSELGRIWRRTLFKFPKSYVDNCKDLTHQFGEDPEYFLDGMDSLGLKLMDAIIQKFIEEITGFKEPEKQKNKLTNLTG